MIDDDFDEDEFDEDEFDEDEFDEDEFDEDDEVEVLPCPECGKSVYEEAEQCPYCGAYIVRSTSPWQGRPWWWLVIGLLGVTAALLMLVSSC